MAETWAEEKGQFKDVAGEAIRGHARVKEAIETMESVVASIEKLDFRHGGIHCLCPFCAQTRETIHAIMLSIERTLKKIR